MRTMLAFLKKECTEQIRSWYFIVLLLVFVFLGIMSPAIAKLTPWLYEIMADALAENGMTVTSMQVDAMTSWMQFFKNIPIGIIVFVLIQSSIFTKEYSSGTLIPVLTKGLERYKVVISKTAVIVASWSIYYWMCFALTYAINEFFWGNDIVMLLWFSALCWWMLGLFVSLLIVLFSSFAKGSTTVLLGTGGVFIGIYLLSLIPKLNEYSPAKLMEASAQLADASGYIKAIVITAVMCIICVVISIPIFNKKQI